MLLCKEQVLRYRIGLSSCFSFSFKCDFKAVFGDEKTQLSAPSRRGHEQQAGLSLHGSHDAFRFLFLSEIPIWLCNYIIGLYTFRLKLYHENKTNCMSLGEHANSIHPSLMVELNTVLAVRQQS